MVLANSDYPDSFPQDFDLQYIPETKILIVEYALPAPEHLPRLKEVKYVKSKDDFTETFLPENELNKLYDDALYQICLRSLHELFDADTANALDAISFNGWVKSIDKATGKEANACVLSIQAKKEEFHARNLHNVDPKTCFKDLKGVGSSKLHSLTPVAPVLAISREDKRFIAPREVVNHLNEGVNLAAMDWEDFEHLIRELFEQEFKQAGGEVKITQASRDHGVDAIAFDPDVIRGGKTVIQAKRYTNTVGVSAVRDLYGTVLNEGASKGILVTTSDYGPDSYEFAKGKPLVLLNGANLLNLMEKHGHKAKIDLKEAKTILGEFPR
jgi:restriction system protein